MLSSTIMYPTGSVNFLPTASNSEAGAIGRSAEYRRRGIFPLGWGYCWDYLWMAHIDTTLTNRTEVIEKFAGYARGDNVTGGVGLDECNIDNSHYKDENKLAAAGFRKGRRPGHMIAGWGANSGDAVFASLMIDGTFDLAMVEGYTYCAGCGDWPSTGKCCPTKGTAHIEQYFDRLDYARAKGYTNRTIFCFGFMLAQSAVNPRGWTAPMLRTAMLKLKHSYPELAGVIMYGHPPDKGFPNATNASTPASNAATVVLIRAASKLMLEFYPDRPVSSHQS